MAKGRVTRDEIAEKDLFKNIGDSAKEQKKYVDLLTTSLNAIKETSKEIKKTVGAANPKSSKELKDFNQLTIASNKAAEARLNIDKKILKEKLLLQELNRKQNRTLKDEAILESRQLGTLEKITIANRRLREERERLDLTTKKGQMSLKRINAELDRNNKIISDNADKNKKRVLGIGQYAKAWDGLRNVLAKVGLVFGALSIARNAFSVISDFQQSQADLASVLGVNIDQMELLTNQAKELGATTKFTASQVAELQTEFAKLGFTQAQINNMTESTLSLAAATGTELAEAASVAGGTLNAFGLQSTDTQRVADVMAKSFSSSALDMTKFSETMKLAAPIARATGVSLEVATAAAGKLADANISGSKAGTDLKNVFSELVKDGKPFQESLEDISKRMDAAETKAEKLAIAEELVGERAKASLLILVDQKEALGELAENLEDAGGSAKEMADKQLETLNGSLALLQSAWEGFILSMDEAGGVGEKLRKGIGLLANNLNEILGVIGKVVRAFVAYRTVLGTLKLIGKVRDLRAYNKELKQSGKAATDASQGVKAFGKALKAIGFAVAIELAIEMAMAFYDIASGAARARFEVDLFNKAKEKGSELAVKQIETVRKSLDAEILAIRERLSLGQISEAEALKQEKAATARARRTILETIKNLRVVKNASLERKATLKDEVADMEKNRSRITDIFYNETKQIEARKNELAGTIATEKQATQSIILLKQELDNLTGVENNLNISINETNRGLDDLGSSANNAKREVLGLTKAQQNLLDSIDTDKEIKDNAADFAIEDAEAQTEAVIKQETERAKKGEEINADLINKKIDQEEELKRKRLKDEYDYSLSLAKNDSERELAHQNYTNGLIRLDAEYATKKKDIFDDLEAHQEDFNEKELEKAKEVAAKKFESQKEYIDLLTDYFVKRADERIKKIQEEIDAATKQSDFYKELAVSGNISAKESLAEQNQIIAEANAQKAEEEKRKQQILMVSSILQSYNANLAAGDDSTEAFTKAITNTTLLTQFIGSLPTFLDGTEDTGVVTNGLDSNGGRLAVLHNNERVLTKEENKAIGDLSNSELVGIVQQSKIQDQIGNVSTSGWNDSGLLSSLNGLKTEMAAVKKAIENKPETNIELGRITQESFRILETKKHKGNVTQKTFKVEL